MSVGFVLYFFLSGIERSGFSYCLGRRVVRYLKVFRLVVPSIDVGNSWRCKFLDGFGNNEFEELSNSKGI